jgi:hypothetical protein
MKDWNDAYKAGVNIRAMADKSMHIRAGMLFRFMARLKLVRNSSHDVLPRSSRNQLTGFGTAALHAASSRSSAAIRRKARAS